MVQYEESYALLFVNSMKPVIISINERMKEETLLENLPAGTNGKPFSVIGTGLFVVCVEKYLLRDGIVIHDEDGNSCIGRNSKEQVVDNEGGIFFVSMKKKTLDMLREDVDKKELELV